MVFNISIDRERELIRRMKLGERAAFDEIVGIYRNNCFAIAYNIVGNAEDAKDVLQDAFIRAYMNIKKFRQDARFSTWFYRILVNAAQDMLRRRSRTAKVLLPQIADEEGNTVEAPDPGKNAANILMDNELGKYIEDSVSGLPERQRLCFVLKHQNGLSTQEIAETLGLSFSTVKVHLFRAARALQDRLRPYLR